MLDLTPHPSHFPQPQLNSSNCSTATSKRRTPWAKPLNPKTTMER